MVDQLAAWYASQGKDVIFLEQFYQQLSNGNWLGNNTRIRRFKSANPGTSEYPLVIVDSGHQVTQGGTNYYNAYKALVDSEFIRAPQAEVSAVYAREGNHLQFEVKITNQSGIVLSRTLNDATVFVIVYEEVVPSAAKSLTSRIDRAVVYQSIETPLNINETATFYLSTADLSGVDWSKLHSVAFIDYRPGGTTGAYDILQAAQAVEPNFDVMPTSLSFIITPQNLIDPEALISISGTPSQFPWSVTPKPAWVSVTPTSGIGGASAVMHVYLSGLQPGLNSGTIQISSRYGLYTQSLTQSILIQVDYTPPPFMNVLPIELHYLIDPREPGDPESKITITGYPNNMTWQVASKPDWVVVTPNSGSVGLDAILKIDHTYIKIGRNNGVVRFSAAGPEGEVSQTISINVYYGIPWSIFFPISERH